MLNLEEQKNEFQAIWERERERDHLEESEEEEEREEKRRRWRWRSFGVGANSVMYGLGGLCSFLFLLFYLFCLLLLSLSLTLSHRDREWRIWRQERSYTQRERQSWWSRKNHASEWGVSLWKAICSTKTDSVLDDTLTDSFIYFLFFSANISFLSNLLIMWPY